jgi:phage shock protein PspC (stress-responsive transcriptional regulator)
MVAMNEDTLTQEMGSGSAGAGPRRLVRTPDKKIAGVGAGIGHYLGVDPTIVRIAFLVLVFAGGIGILLYAACWLVMPKGDASTVHESSDVDPWTAVGIVGLVAGVGLLVGWHGIGDIGRVAVAVALVIGGVLLIGRTTRDEGVDGGGAPVAPPPPSPPGDGALDDPRVEPTGELAHQDPETSGEAGAAEVASARRDRAPLTALVVAILSIGLAVVLAAGLDGRFEVGWSMTIAAGLVVVGVGLAVSSVTGGAPWLIPVGIVLALALLTAAVTEPIADRGVGSRSHTVLAATTLQPEYRLGVGELVVDLSALDVDGSTRAVEVRLGIGSAEVIVPELVTVDLRGHVGAGRLEAPDGTEVDGVGRDLDLVDPGTPPAGPIVLELEVGMGEGVVRRG